MINDVHQSESLADVTPLPSSFRDPSGYVAHVDGEFLRVISPGYRQEYEHLRNSGLYDRLVSSGLLIEHTPHTAKIPGALCVLKPRQLTFVSYPYEWCFSAWRDAAETTLQIQETAMAAGMTLKDASAYNIQFVDGKPKLIDLLSFEKFDEKPWVAYAQFCRHFLAPLALMSHCDGRLGQMLREHIDGIPLDLASKLLPAITRLKPSLFLHLHLHARTQRLARNETTAGRREKSFSRGSLLGLVQTLRSAIRSLKYSPRRDVWANYYTETVTGGGYVAGKQQLVDVWLKELQPKIVWDIGANTGLFSRIAANLGAETFGFDGDIECVELTYRELRQKPQPRLLPLYMDLANPSPGLGWAHQERLPWLARANPDTVLALAIIHHLAIGNNVPLSNLATFFARFSPSLIIEFVPKEDPNARKLLDVRKDIFPGYTREAFEAEFGRRFAIKHRVLLPDSERMLYFMERCP